MRITFLLTQSLESPSGLGRYWPIALELTRLGHEVTILALHHNLRELKQRRFNRDGVEIWYVGQMHVRKFGSQKQYFGTLPLLWTVFLSTFGLLWAALSVPTDVYHLGKPHPMNGVAGLFAHWIRGKPLYLDCDDYEAASNHFSKPWQRRIVAFFEDHLPHFMQGVTVNTRFNANRLKNLGYPANQVVYVPNGVDQNRFADINPDAISALRSSLGLDGKHVVLYLGSMSLANHAVDLLLDAFVEVLASEPQSVLLLVGGGEDYSSLQRRSQELGLGDAVRFVGRVAPDQVPHYYRLATLSVDPVKDDSTAAARSPLKLFESLASDVPFVSSDVGDRSELLGFPRAGILTRPGDRHSLSEAILYLLVNRDIQEGLIRLGNQKIKRYYWSRLIHQFLEVYR